MFVADKEAAYEYARKRASEFVNHHDFQGDANSPYWWGRKKDECENHRFIVKAVAERPPMSKRDEADKDGSHQKLFIVRANSGQPGEGSFRVDKVTRKDAVETAVGLLGQGMEGVAIADEAGRIYRTSKFERFLADEDF